MRASSGAAAGARRLRAAGCRDRPIRGIAPLSCRPSVIDSWTRIAEAWNQERQNAAAEQVDSRRRAKPMPGKFRRRCHGMSFLESGIGKRSPRRRPSPRRSAPALAQKSGGILHMYHRDSPASMSILEEATISTVIPVMGVMNNLVMFDQHKPQNSLDTIVPDLADELELERGRQVAHLQAARRRQMARRQAVHRQGRQMHLRPAAGQGHRRICVSTRARAGTKISKM